MFWDDSVGNNLFHWWTGWYLAVLWTIVLNEEWVGTSSSSSRWHHSWTTFDIVHIQSIVIQKFLFSEDRISAFWVLFLHLQNQAPTDPLGSWEGQRQLLPTRSCRQETKASTEVKAWALVPPCFWAFRKHVPGKAGSVQGPCCAGSPEGEIPPCTAPAEPAVTHGEHPSIGSVLGIWWEGRRQRNKCRTVGSGIWWSD